ncbi:MAG TPA: hypothetical protein VFQ53_33830 [Kofleriaceae bacterium]|nr:hypothetical protein [Kofleriaceae bacterium]
MRRALAVFIVLVLAGTASATPYETFVDVSDQQDLEDLLAAGDITQDTFDELIELLESGVDLDTADRAQLYALPNLTYQDVDAIIAYREKQNGVIADPAGLVAAGALSEDKLLAISAFLIVTEARDRYALKGWIRAMTRYTPGDDLVPPFALRGRFTALKHVQAGFAAAFTRLDIGAPQYDPNRNALIADPRGYHVEVPKVFLKYEDDEATVIGGSFRAGFAQRLTFDNSKRYTPNGLYFDDDLFFSTELVRACRESAGELAESPCTGPAGDKYVTPDWSWRDGLFGVGAGFKRLEVGGAGWLQGYVWASASKRSIYQYELVDRSQVCVNGVCKPKCEDPSADNDPNCAAPTVFVRPDGNLLDQTSRFSFVTLPDVFQERLAGANVSYFADRRNSVGLTAYGAVEENLVDGITLDTQEWSRLPTGRKFGAAGANFSFGRDWLDVFGEASWSYDEMPDVEGPARGGGGGAAILRVTATKKHQELEGSLRYFGIDYANPYARPISQPDELNGQRARDEAGFRLRYYGSDKLYSLRAQIDLWEPPSARDASELGRPQRKIDTYVRGDVKTTSKLTLGLWERYQDKDLGAAGHDECFEVSTEFDENGEPIPCGGRQLTTIGRARYAFDRWTSVTAMLEHQLLDDPALSESSFRQDVAAWLIVLWNPDPGIRVRGRARYLDEAISDDTYLERSLSTVLDAAFHVRGRDIVRVRADGKFYLDNRESTLSRSPNPELQLWLSYEARL